MKYLLISLLIVHFIIYCIVMIDYYCTNNKNETKDEIRLAKRLSIITILYILTYIYLYL